MCAGLTGTVYSRLQDSGYFFDPVQREVEQQVLPWLLQETEKEVARRNTARSVLLSPSNFQTAPRLCFDSTWSNPGISCPVSCTRLRRTFLVAALPGLPLSGCPNWRKPGSCVLLLGPTLGPLGLWVMLCLLWGTEKDMTCHTVA